MLFKKTVKITILFFIVNASALHATNGDQMIATGTRSMGMGGVSVAMPFGAESGLANPALITYVRESEISGSVTFFFPSIESQTLLDNTRHESASDFYLMPSVQYATHLGGGAYMGLGVWGVAGMGVDFSDISNLSGLAEMRTDLMLMHIAVPLAYRQSGISVGIAPILQAGMLDIEYDSLLLGPGHPFDKEWEADIGAVVGAAWDFGNGLILGAKYRTPISMRYDNSAGGNDLTLQQPGEFGAGFSYTVGPHTLAFDYKRIQWGSADGYEAFGWKDQDVYALGYRYRADGWALRLGYNHGKSPIDTSRLNLVQDYLNLLGFPATSENHYTAGLSCTLGESWSLDLAAVYSPEEETSSALRDAATTIISNRHSEFSLTVQVDYRF